MRAVAITVLGALAVTAGCGSSERAEPSPTIDAQSPVVPILQGGFDAPLVPVRVGGRIYRLLVDTGSNYLVLFDDLVPSDDPGVRREAERISLRYAAATRTGHVATAEVQIGQQVTDRLRILLVDSSRRDEDPSLAPKGADGVLGLRLEPGDVSEVTRAQLDPPMIALGISRYELRLAGAGGPGTAGSLALNVSPSFEAFASRTMTLQADAELVETFGNCELPVIVASPSGAVQSPRNLSLDTGAVTTFAADLPIRTAIGLDSLGPDAAITLAYDGPERIDLGAPVRAGDVDAKVLSSSNTYGAVVGVPWLSRFVFGFELDPGAGRAAVRLLDLTGGPVPFPETREPTGTPRFTVVNDLEEADITLDGQPIARGDHVTIEPRPFLLETSRVVRTADGTPFRRRYVHAFEPRADFSVGECLLEASEGVIVADYRLARGTRGARPEHVCDPCPDLTVRSCGATSVVRSVQSLP